jgi:hypothetical protein
MTWFYQFLENIENLKKSTKMPLEQTNIWNLQSTRLISKNWFYFYIPAMKIQDEINKVCSH